MRIKPFVSFFITLLFIGSVLFADTETLVIDAIIPGQDIIVGESHALFVQDLFLQSQNLIVDGEEVEIGHGSALFTDKPVPLFVVSHVTNYTRPVTISVEVSPFTYTADDGTVAVLSTNVQSQAGLDAYIGDIDSLFVPEVNPDGMTVSGGMHNKPPIPTYAGAKLQITNNDKQVLNSHDSSQTESSPESLTLNSIGSCKQDKYKFTFLAFEKTGEEGWTHEGGFLGFGGEWTWSSDTALSYKTKYTKIPNGGFITEYVEYSVNITDENVPADGRYVMNVTVSLTTEE